MFAQKTSVLINSIIVRNKRNVLTFLLQSLDLHCFSLHDVIFSGRSVRVSWQFPVM